MSNSSGGSIANGGNMGGGRDVYSGGGGKGQRQGDFVNTAVPIGMLSKNDEGECFIVIFCALFVCCYLIVMDW